MATRPLLVVPLAPAPPSSLDRLGVLGSDLTALEARIRNLEAEVSEQRALTGLLIRTLADVRRTVTDRR